MIKNFIIVVVGILFIFIWASLGSKSAKIRKSFMVEFLLLILSISLTIHSFYQFWIGEKTLLLPMVLTLLVANRILSTLNAYECIKLNESIELNKQILGELKDIGGKDD